MDLTNHPTLFITAHGILRSNRSIFNSTSPTNPSSRHPTEAWDRIRSHQAFVAPPTQPDGILLPGCTRIVCISDTHGYHRSIPIPTCDILIHGGDFTNYGEPEM
jgi:hypothetical protein